MAGQFDSANLPTRPDVYINFVNAASDQIAGGARGIVAIPLKTYAGTAVATQFYTITANTLSNARGLFGEANIQSIKFALQAGAKEVLVYAMPEQAADENVYADTYAAFEARPFNVFVFDGEVQPAEQDAALSWCNVNREEGKHFMVVFGGTAADDQDITLGNARTTRLLNEYAVNVANGVVIGDTQYSSSQFAPYIAGLIAGTAINASITFRELPVADVTKRLRNSEVKAALEAGTLVLTHDGDAVRIEQGLTTSASKIRIQRARQAVSTDITKTARKSYIGKLDNSEAGQVTLISAIEAYLRGLSNENVLADPAVQLDSTRESVGDSVFLAVSYVELDSMERIFITINV